MKNATLVINNNEGLSDDIWQCKAEFTEKQWEETLECFADALQEIYDYLDTTEEYGGGDARVYQLGDVINLLSSIGISLSEGSENV